MKGRILQAMGTCGDSKVFTELLKFQVSNDTHGGEALLGKHGQLLGTNITCARM